MRKIKCKSKNRAFKNHFIGFIALTALLSASCAAIPGATECNTVVDSFMEAAAAKDVDTACTLLPTPVSEANRKDIEEFILNNYVLFEDYQDIKMQGISVNYNVYSAEGDEVDIAEYSGEVKYAGGFGGWVEAELMKQGEEWKLTNIWVDVSPEKLDDYIRRHGN